MSRSQPRRERKPVPRPTAADLRGWVDDFVAVRRTPRFEDCVAALTAAGYQLPPSDGWERLKAVWDEVQVQVLDNWRF